MRGDFFKTKKACKLIKHKDQIKFWEQSKQNFDNEVNNNPSYTIKSYINWADGHNYGCTNFGLHPEKLPRDMLRLYIFHMILQITKMIMNSIQEQLK